MTSGTLFSILSLISCVKNSHRGNTNASLSSSPPPLLRPLPMRCAMCSRCNRARKRTGIACGRSSSSIAISSLCCTTRAPNWSTRRAPLTFRVKWKCGAQSLLTLFSPKSKPSCSSAVSPFQSFATIQRYQRFFEFFTNVTKMKTGTSGHDHAHWRARNSGEVTRGLSPQLVAFDE